jgi:hypothetical protein
VSYLSFVCASFPLDMIAQPLRTPAQS